MHARRASGNPRPQHGARARQCVAARAPAAAACRHPAAGGAALPQRDASAAAVPAGPFDPKTAGKGLLDLLCRAADLPNFATVDAHVAETQQKVRASFNQIFSGVGRQSRPQHSFGRSPEWCEAYPKTRKDKLGGMHDRASRLRSTGGSMAAIALAASGVSLSCQAMHSR